MFGRPGKGRTKEKRGIFLIITKSGRERTGIGIGIGIGREVLTIQLTGLQTSTRGLNATTKFSIMESRYYILWDFIQVDSLKGS